jgi:hypothetical protein
MEVAEAGQAAYFAAEGEIPFRLTPNEEYQYADLSNAAGEFGTLDFSEDAPLFYLGHETTLAQLGITSAAEGRGPEIHHRL